MSQLIPDGHMPLRPIQHYEIADSLLARAEEMQNDTLPIARAVVARAQVHAMLAACPEYYPDESGYESLSPDGYYGFRPLETRTPTGERL